MDQARAMREEAAICRQLAREITDFPSIEMLLDRAVQLEARAAALERERIPTPPQDKEGAWRDLLSPTEWDDLVAGSKRSRRGGPRAR